MTRKLDSPIKLVYVASPFTYKNGTQEDRVRIETQRYIDITYITAELVRKYGIAPIAPITMSYNFREAINDLGSEFHTWADIDYRYISACDEIWVVMMDGWLESIGVQSEIKFAVIAGIPVKLVTLDSFELVDYDPIKLQEI